MTPRGPLRDSLRIRVLARRKVNATDAVEGGRLAALSRPSSAVRRKGQRARVPGWDDGAPRGAAIQVRAQRLAFRRKRAWTMNTAPTAMTSQSHKLKPSSIPSATVRTMIKVNAAMNAQFLKRECDSATSSSPPVDPVAGCYSPPCGGGATTGARSAATPNRSEPRGWTAVRLSGVDQAVYDQVVDNLVAVRRRRGGAAPAPKREQRWPQARREYVGISLSGRVRLGAVDEHGARALIRRRKPHAPHVGEERNPWHGRARLSPGSKQASRRLGRLRLRITTRVYVPMKPGRITRIVIAVPAGR
jgi:hypothetical protein